MTRPAEKRCLLCKRVYGHTEVSVVGLPAAVLELPLVSHGVCPSCDPADLDLQEAA